MKILMLTENDPAGSAILFKNAINRYTEHPCRLITTAEKYCFGFEKDIHWPDAKHGKLSEGNVEKRLQEADIFHFHILSDESMEIGPFKVKDYIKGKKIVHHHHGHPDFRANPDKYRIKYRELKRKVLVSTPDLLLGLPSAYWMPNLVPIDDPDYMPTEERYPEFTIGHSPTRTDLKDTARLIEACDDSGIRVDVIMNTNHRECLRRKQKCHAIFDHCQGYYGMSSLEGLSMGKPVMANLSDWVENNIRDFAETEKIPWLKNLAFGYMPDFWEWASEIGAESRRFMENHWNPERVVNRLIKFYEGL